MKFWQFVCALILLSIAGAVIYRIIYTLRTGRDLSADRAAAVAQLVAARKSAGVQTAASMPAAAADPTQSLMPAVLVKDPLAALNAQLP